jgi:hypothetical protein
MTMNGHGPIGTVPDLVAMRSRQQEKERVPDYDPGTPELGLQVGVPLGPNGAPRFTDAMDRAAQICANDGWAIESVSQCTMVGMNEQGYGFFQVVVTAKRA